MSYAILDNVFDSCVILDRDRNIIYRNQSFADLVQISLLRISVGSDFNKYFIFEEADQKMNDFGPFPREMKCRELPYKTVQGLKGVALVTMFNANEDGHFLLIMRDMTVEVELHKKYKRQLEERERHIAKLNELKGHLEIQNQSLELMVEQKVQEIKKLYELESQARLDIQKAYDKVKTLHLQLIENAKLASLGEMSAGIAHELNNPLMCVMGYTHIISQSVNESNTAHVIKDMVEKIQFSARKMALIIKNMERFGKGSVRKEWNEFSIEAALKNSLSLFQGLLENHGIKIMANVMEQMPLIYGESTLIESIFNNLFTNSRDAFDTIKDKRKKVITIDIIFDGTYIEVKYKDNAGGMSENTKRRIFDPFFTTKEVGKGTGLGMPVAYGIIREHHGTIVVESEEGEGSEFIIRFPKKTKQEEKKESQLNGDLRELKTLRQKHPKLWLVGEDLLSDHIFVEKLFEYFEVEPFPDCNSLPESPAHHSYEIIIFDYKLIFGKDSKLISTCKRENPEIPVVVVCQNTDESLDIGSVLAMGADEVILKSFLNSNAVRDKIVKVYLSSYPPQL